MHYPALKYFRFAAKSIFFIFLILVSCAKQPRYQQLIPIKPPEPLLPVQRNSAEPDFQHTLNSFQQLDGITTMTFHGNFDNLITMREKQIAIWFQQNRSAIDSIHCSVFAHLGDSSSALLGRNFDNIATDIFAGFYFPDNGYASVAFTPMHEFGFTAEMPFMPDSVTHKQRFLMAPAVPTEGINEKGLALALATNGREAVTPDSTKDPLFLTHLVRKILDHCATANEAAQLAAKYHIFDNGLNLICHHILVADAAGHSLVLEWANGKMHVIPANTNWQAVTNFPLFERTESMRASACSRYARLHRKLRKTSGDMSWQQGMDRLAETVQRNQYYTLAGQRQCVNTEWSAVFDIKQRQIYLCADMNFHTVYTLPVVPNPINTPNSAISAN